MLKIGVLGVGHLGKIHIKCIQEIAGYSLEGFFDTDEQNSKHVVKEFGIKQFNSIDELIAAVDVVDIVTPTIAHFELAAKALKQFRHVFIEKPIVATPEQALSLMQIASEANVKVQVGHVERFNPAMIAAEPFIENPMFIEAHRLAGFNLRGTDVPVILDLMIHDIDIILHLVKAELRKISASGVAVISRTADIANARLEFSNGCVANLTASRISLKPMRKTRIFQRDAYVAIDFLEKKTEIVRLKGMNESFLNSAIPPMEIGIGEDKKQLVFEKPTILPSNAIKTELESFASSILNNKIPYVTLNDGYLALQVAHQIMEKVERNIN